MLEFVSAPTPRLRAPPGINPDASTVYTPVSNAAKRTYAEHQGWIKVVHSKKRQRQLARNATRFEREN